MYTRGVGRGIGPRIPGWPPTGVVHPQASFALILASIVLMPAWVFPRRGVLLVSRARGAVFLLVFGIIWSVLCNIGAQTNPTCSAPFPSGWFLGRPEPQFGGNRKGYLIVLPPGPGDQKNIKKNGPTPASLQTSRPGVQ